jgi:hypothetical protein
MVDHKDIARRAACEVLGQRLTALVGRDVKGDIPKLKATIAAVRAGNGDHLLSVRAACAALEISANEHARIAKRDHNMLCQTVSDSSPDCLVSGGVAGPERGCEVVLPGVEGLAGDG